MGNKIEIMDTTLRDGEQTSGVSFSISEKLTLAKLLLQELNIDRIEIASARVSKGELEAVKEITSWGESNNYLNRIEVLTFVDNGASIEWMKKTGAKVQNLLTKGSLNHLKHQLKQEPLEHFDNISKSINEAQKEGFITNVYLEDWSNGMSNSEEYVFQYLDFITKQPISRVLLPDTLGVLTPEKTFNYINKQRLDKIGLLETQLLKYVRNSHLAAALIPFIQKQQKNKCILYTKGSSMSGGCGGRWSPVENNDH